MASNRKPRWRPSKEAKARYEAQLIQTHRSDKFLPLQQYFLAGLNADKLAKIYNYSPGYIRIILSHRGLTMRSREPQSDKAMVYVKPSHQKIYQATAHKLGISTTTIFETILERAADYSLILSIMEIGNERKTTNKQRDHQPIGLCTGAGELDALR